MTAASQADRRPDTGSISGRCGSRRSSAVVGLLAKPIIDLAVGLRKGGDVLRVQAILEDEGWIYRGDAGTDGGLVFVLKTSPWFRVAPLHCVEYGSNQWSDYLRFPDLLRVSADARERYESEKLRLIDTHSHDRRAYTNGKTPVVRALLGPSERSESRERTDPSMPRGLGAVSGIRCSA